MKFGLNNPDLSGLFALWFYLVAAALGLLATVEWLRRR